MTKQNENGLLTFGGHLSILRGLIIRILFVVTCLSIIVFIFKTQTFSILLGPSEWNFVSYRWIQSFIRLFSPDFAFEEFHVDLIATDLSSQFMTHITTSLYLGLLCASPYILFELFRFVSPALYDRERKYSIMLLGVVYALFVFGILMSYFILFPISFRFLGTYSVAERIHSTITLDSYISTFINLSLLMGVVFQLPVLSYVLGKLGFIDVDILKKYRKQALILIMILAAIITPPDLMTLILVTLPLYMLYEVSIWVLKIIKPKKQQLIS